MHIAFSNLQEITLNLLFLSRTILNEQCSIYEHKHAEITTITLQ